MALLYDWCNSSYLNNCRRRNQTHAKIRSLQSVNPFPIISSPQEGYQNHLQLSTPTIPEKSKDSSDIEDFVSEAFTIVTLTFF